MTTSQQRLSRYAELVVRVGANVQPGQHVVLTADVDHLEIARAVAEQAYAAGARVVEMNWLDPHVRRSALVHAPLEALREVEQWQLDRVAAWREKGIASITLTGTAEPRLFDGIAAERVVATNLDYLRAVRTMRMSGDIQWTIVAAPNPGWAEQVFGEPDVDRLWDRVAVAMRLDSDDVVAEWRRHAQDLEDRASTLTGLRLNAVRYHGNGTDLTVGLIPDCRWTGGGLHTRNGVFWMPNLPTEEVFTSPDRRRADGVFRATRPLVMPVARVLVEDLVVTVEGGRIVDAQASRGLDAVLAELDSDEGARSFGEVSLVDGSSRVRAAGVTFHDTLYDENTGGHVAWGAGFPFSVPAGQDPAEAGLNVSTVHTDVVIGGPGVDVDGVRPDGSVVPLIREDTWAF